MLIPTIEDVRDHLIAGRYEEARFVALQSSWKPRMPAEARDAIRDGRYQDAICRIEHDLNPRQSPSKSRIGADWAVAR